MVYWWLRRKDMKPEGDRPLFPRRWKWERYEPAMREWAGQLGRFLETKDRLSTNEQEAYRILSELWRRDQMKKGLFPPDHERERRGDKYIAVLDRLLTDARAQMKAGTLTAGTAHVALYPKLMSEYAQHLQQEKSDSRSASEVHERTSPNARHTSALAQEFLNDTPHSDRAAAPASSLQDEFERAAKGGDGRGSGADDGGHSIGPKPPDPGPDIGSGREH